MGVPVRLFGAWCPERWRNYVYALGSAWTLLRERRRFQIAYFLMGGIQLAVVLPVVWWLGKGIVMKFSGSNTITPLTKSWLGRFELRLLRACAHRILVLNPAMVEEAVSAGFSRAQLDWMPNPVDVDVFHPVDAATRAGLRHERGVPADATVVLFAGRLAPEKQLSTLLQAFALVSRERPDVFLILLGDGPERQNLLELAARLGLAERIRFAGAVPADAVPCWLQLADIFALVSSLEGLPCALLEAMSVGLPGVVSDIPANLQLIEDGVHGCVARCGDPAAIASVLMRLADNPALRHKLGDAARQRIVEQYSTGKVISRYERLFSQIHKDATARQASGGKTGRPQTSGAI